MYARRWHAARPWHTNAALILIGAAMICFTRQLTAEYDHYTIGFSGVSSSQMVLYLAALAIFLYKPRNVDRYTFPIILAVAILCRLVALFPEPFLSSDVYRYAWDGVVQHAHINPYRYVPGDKALTFLREPNQDLFDNMNRRDYAHTIYPPAAQMLFYCITFISPVVTGMKMAMVLFEGLTMVGLVKLLRHFGKPREWTLLYAWFPMAIWEFSGSGHLDAMVIAFLVFALLFRYRRQPVLTGLFLGLAVLTKFYPLVLFPAMYRRGDWKMPATMAALAVVCYAPYLTAGRLVFGFLGGYVQEEGMATGTRYFLLELAQHLPGLHGFPNNAYLVFAGGVFLALTVWAWRTGCRDDSPRAAFLPPAFGFALALMLLFSPHYPWYVAWLLPFFVLMPSLTVLTYVGGLFYLCTTALAVGYGPKQYELNEILYGAVTIALMIELGVRHVPQVRAWLGARTVVEREHSLSG
jgi:alpha-1,6-mannosyltransferase